jgi:hypothetical protein
VTVRLRTAIASTLLAALAGCAGCDDVPAGAVEDCNPQIAVSARTDLLLVVDDSGSMAGEQAELAQNLSDFIDALVTTSAAALDLHVGVTNTSIARYDGSSGYDGTSGFPGAQGTPYPSAGTSTWGGLRILSSGPLLAQDFKANVLHGDWGSGKEQPLAAMRMAIEKAAAGGVNAGFRRQGARLAVVIITDEDDCSESVAPYQGTSQASCASQTNKDQNFDPLSDFVTLLDTTVGGEPLVAVIAGFDPTTLDPTGCSSGTSASSQDPTRLDDFVAALDAAHPGRTHKDSICSEYGPALAAIADKLVPQRIFLDEVPADPDMLVPRVVRADGSVQTCVNGTDVTFTAPQAGVPASLTFQNACKLQSRDRVDIQIVCAR